MSPIKKFFHELAKKRNCFEVQAKLIRCKANGVCPIIEVSGIQLPTDTIKANAWALGVGVDDLKLSDALTQRIMYAADWVRCWEPKVRSMRRHMLRILGLEEVA